MRAEHRLALLFAGVLAITTALAMISLRLIIVGDATSLLDASLRAEAAQVAGVVHSDDDLKSIQVQEMVALEDPRDLAERNPLLVVRDQRGEVVASSLPAAGRGQLLAGPLGPAASSAAPALRTVSLGKQSLRVYSRSLRDDEGNVVGTVQVGGRMEPLRSGTARLEQMLLAEGLFAIVLGCVAAAALTRHTLRPLSDIARFLETTASRRPHQRLAPEGPPDIRLVARALNQMLDRFDQTDADRRRFLMTISHELRTPLTALQGSMEVMLLDPELDPSLRGQLDSIYAEIGRLLRLSQNLLSSEQARAGLAIERVPVDLEDLVLDIAREVQREGGERLTIEIAQPVEARVDPDRLRQAMLNLLDNAFRHGGRCAVLRLCEEGGEAVIEVEDDGPGVPLAERDLVFQPFYRAEAMGGGSGLGLAVVSAVADAHSGSVEVLERDGRAVRFRLRLPRGADSQCDDIASAGDIIATTR